MYIYMLIITILASLVDIDTCKYIFYVCMRTKSLTWLERNRERWGAGVEYHFQEFNEPYAPS